MIIYPSKDILRSSNYLVLDFETTTLEYGSALNSSNSIILACWYLNRTGEHKATWGGEEEQVELLRDITTVDFIVAHNAKFELQWLKRCGVDLRKVLPACTLLGQWVINGNLNKPLGLDALADAYNIGGKIGPVSQLIAAGWDVRDIPKAWLLEYCHKDVELTQALFEIQRRQLIERNQLHIWLTRNLTCAVLADIEFNGLCLDPDRVREEVSKQREIVITLGKELADLTQGINLNSPKQVAAFLYDTLGFSELTTRGGKPDRTPTGGRKAGADVIPLLKAVSSEQIAFRDLYVRYRNASQLLSKNLNFFEVICNENNGIAFASFNQGRTATHRLSSSGRAFTSKATGETYSVQFQNLPRQYKRLFKARESGWLIGEVDGSQLEFRVAADLTRDQQAREDIENGEDIHTNTATTLTNAGQPTTRQEAKAMTFRPLYGGEAGTTAEREYVKFFQKRYKAIYLEQMGWVSKVLQDKYLRTPVGMLFFWPDAAIVNNRTGRVNHKTSIFNFPVQNGATGEIIPLALWALWCRIENRRINILNTIHDSVVTEMHPDEQEFFEENATKALTEDVFRMLELNYDYEFEVPLGVGIKVAPHWGDTKHEVSINVWRDGRTVRSEK